MKVIAVYSLKGGVGKTTTCVNLSYCAAMTGMISLIWDLDPQGAATFYYQLRPKVRGGAAAMLGKQAHLGNFTKSTSHKNLDIIPSDLSYRHLDLMLEEMKKSKARLKKSLDELSTEYQYVFIDCPPSINVLAEHIFEVADVVLFPIIPTTLAERAFVQVRKLFKKNGYDREKLLPFFSLVDKRKKLHKDTLEDFRQRYPETLETLIPSASLIEKMGIYQSPLPSYAPLSPSAIAYKSLWLEVAGLVSSSRVR